MDKKESEFSDQRDGSRETGHRRERRPNNRRGRGLRGSINSGVLREDFYAGKSKNEGIMSTGNEGEQHGGTYMKKPGRGRGLANKSVCFSTETEVEKPDDFETVTAADTAETKLPMNNELQKEMTYYDDDYASAIYTGQGWGGVCTSGNNMTERKELGSECGCVDEMCQFCDGRRGPWALPEKNFKPDPGFLKYQRSIVESLYRGKDGMSLSAMEENERTARELNAKSNVATRENEDSDKDAEMEN